MDGVSPTWSPQQAAALDAAHAWLKSAGRGSDPVFRLFGYAGTGKTTLARHLAAGVSGAVCYAAFTGKAALVMRRAGCPEASTIHSLIYTPVAKADGTVSFRLNEDSALRTARLLIVDECSMVDADLARDLLSFGKPILVLGDPAQLPPVRDAGFFTNARPDAMLTEIHRQSAGNPIIRLATDVREGRALRHGDHGGGSRVIGQGVLDEAELLAADQVIVGLNRTRQIFNARLRAALGCESAMPEEGDRLVCLRNDRRLGIFNGGLFTLCGTPRRLTKKRLIRLHVQSEDFPERAPFAVDVRPEFFTGTAETLTARDLRDSQHFDYGYALTCHKAQGSQWRHVIAYDESGAFRAEARRWLYTAITRAAERITLVR